MPQPFDYHRPATRAEALDLLARPGFHAVPLIVHPKPTAPRQMGAEAFVDLSLLGLDYLRAEADGSVHIGSLATLQTLVESPLLQHGPFQLLARAAGLVAGPGIRNLAGLWGTLQARSGPPEMRLALLALKAQVVLLAAGEKQRTLSCPEFYSMGPKALKEGELVLEGVLPAWQATGWGLERVARTPRDEAIVAAAAVVELKNGKASRVSLALAGANPQPVGLAEVEKKLAGRALDEPDLQAAAEAAAAQSEPVGDFRGGIDYRRAMAALVTRRALEQAWKRAASRETKA